MINSCIKKRLNHLSLKTLDTNITPYQPLRIIPTHTQTTQPIIAAGQSTATNTQPPPEYMSTPYVQDLSEKLSGILQPINIKIASRNVNNLFRFFKPTKDRVSKLDTADVVYNIPCTDCTANFI